MRNLHVHHADKTFFYQVKIFKTLVFTVFLSYLSSEYMSSRLFWMGVPVTAQRARALSWQTAMEVCTFGFLMLWASSRITRAQVTRRRGAECDGWGNRLVLILKIIGTKIKYQLQLCQYSHLTGRILSYSTEADKCGNINSEMLLYALRHEYIFLTTSAASLLGLSASSFWTGISLETKLYVVTTTSWSASLRDRQRTLDSVWLRVPKQSSKLEWKFTSKRWGL